MDSKNNKILKVGVKLNFLNKTKFKISKSFFEKAFLTSIKVLEIPRPALLEIYLVSQNEIKEINSKWRAKFLPTDVISFEVTNKNTAHYPEISDKRADANYLNPMFWGIIFLCPNFIKTRAKKVDLQFKRYLLWAFIHGIIHCVGYDHEKSSKEEKLMRQFEKQILNKTFSY
jgi:probable rRNA maturation factor